MAYSWPGNVRELRNVIESMVVIDSDGVLDVDDLTEDLQATASPPGEAGRGADSLVGHKLSEIEKYYILETLRMTNGNREEAAELLGIGERHALPQARRIPQAGDAGDLRILSGDHGMSPHPVPLRVGTG